MRCPAARVAMTARVIKQGIKVDVREEVGVGRSAVPRRAAGRLGERLSQSMRRRFVGRDAEITIFTALLNRSEQRQMYHATRGSDEVHTQLHQYSDP